LSALRARLAADGALGALGRRRHFDAWRTPNSRSASTIALTATASGITGRVIAASAKAKHSRPCSLFGRQRREQTALRLHLGEEGRRHEMGMAVDDHGFCAPVNLPATPRPVTPAARRQNGPRP
jgi:hypothetical protein